MVIQGPFRIETLEETDKGIRELHFTFTHEFQALEHELQIASFDVYIELLQSEIHKTEDFTNRQGMMTVLQISEQLLPHLRDNQLPLDETIIVEMGEQTEGSSLTELLNKSNLN